MSDPNQYINLVKNNSAWNAYAASRAGLDRNEHKLNLYGTTMYLDYGSLADLQANRDNLNVFRTEPTEKEKAEARKKAELYYRELQAKYAEQQQNQKNKPDDGPAEDGKTLTPNGFKFNLPPHKWSLPIQPMTVDQAKAADGTNKAAQIGRAHV